MIYLKCSDLVFNKGTYKPATKDAINWGCYDGLKQAANRLGYINSI